MSRVVFAVVVVAVSLNMSACSHRQRPVALEERPAEAEPGAEIDADAYLFDAKLRLEGKPRSFRLEIYHTDSVAALAGRAYLGRGALRGRLTSDSLLVYFPSRNEYVNESTATLLSASECLRPGGSVNLLRLLTSSPDQVLDTEQFLVTTDTSDSRKSCQVRGEDCPWKIDLVYDRDGKEWLLREFAVDNGDNMRLTARRRTFKKHTGIDCSRFQVPIPATAVPISL